MRSAPPLRAADATRAAGPLTLATAARALRAGTAALLVGGVLVGCGKSLPSADRGRGAGVTTVAGGGALGASGLATKNTTRLGGADPVADAAAVALAVSPGLTPATRPAAVVLANEHNWPIALAAGALAGAPLRAPLLYSDGNTLPSLSGQALAAMRPTGSARLRGAQVIELDTTAAPAGYRTRVLAGGTVPGTTPGASGSVPAKANPISTEQAATAVLAARLERLVAVLHGGHVHHVIVIGADGPRALAMPAAGLAAETGAPILPVYAGGIPAATRGVLAHLHRPAIYAIGPPAAISQAVLGELAQLGSVRRVAGGTGLQEATRNAIAVARYSDGAFGWGVEEPGHGLVFANAARPLDAPAAAPLSATGDYGPLLLLEAPDAVPTALATYLSDIQPGYTNAPEYRPVRGVYNHGWLIGDEQAIAATTQAELDALLEIAPRSSTGAPAESSAPAEPGAPTEPTP